MKQNAGPQWIKHFPGRYVGLAFGTNDINYWTSDEDLYNNYKIMVEAVLKAGKIPVVPTVPWFRDTGGAERAEHINSIIDQVRADYPQIVDGPDFWTYYYTNQNMISDDNLHPSWEGYLMYRRLWAEKMLEIVYNGNAVLP